ncbi:MAG: C39 family peptidase [Candidatus Faecousia sp.]|nr:C39 family peptidase [Candidatus Faecousia sp.]
MKHGWKAAWIFLLVTGLCACASQAPVPQPTAAETTVPTETLPPETQAPTIAETQPEGRTYDTVPLFYQTDYPYIKFGDGTIATSGCSMTCLSMVATYMTDHEYTPDQLVYHFGKYGKTNVERLEYAAQQLGLPYEKNFDWRETQKALEEGKVAIVMENDHSPFTTGQHFIVLSGLTDDGLVIVKDPFEPNYSSELLMDGFLGGFHEYTITSGYSGSWVFDKSEMPENPELYDARKPQQPETRYVGYELPEEDIYTLACLAWVQARNQPEEVQQAVLEVILNRLVSDEYPNTVDKVLWWSETFGSVYYLQNAKPEPAQYRAVTAAMYGPYVLPRDVLYYAPWQIGGEVWGQVGDYWFAYREP